MQQNILKLARSLISIPSVHENSQGLKVILEVAKKELRGFHIGEFESGGVTSILFSNTTKPTKQFRIILNAHLDVVPGTAKQYSPEVKDGKLHGRGAYDMKAAAAVMILLFKEIGKKVDFPLGLQLTTDEEVGGANGTGYQIKKGLRTDFVITGEGTSFRIINEAKARIILKLTANGKTSHAAYPWLGENAIWKMTQAINRLYNVYPLPSSEWNGTTFNITTISTDNHTLNKTPDYCEATVNIRVIPQEKDTIVSDIKKIVSEDITVEQTEDSYLHQTNPDSPYIKKLQAVTKEILGIDAVLSRAHGGSDACHYTAVGCEGIEFGPIGGNHHADEEWVDVESLVDYYNILKKFLLRC